MAHLDCQPMNCPIINGSGLSCQVLGKLLCRNRKPAELAAEMCLLWMTGKATFEEWGLSTSCGVVAMVERDLHDKLKKSIKVMAGPGQWIPATLTIKYFCFIFKWNKVCMVTTTVKTKSSPKWRLNKAGKRNSFSHSYLQIQHREVC